MVRTLVCLCALTVLLVALAGWRQSGAGEIRSSGADEIPSISQYFERHTAPSPARAEQSGRVERSAAKKSVEHTIEPPTTSELTPDLVRLRDKVRSALALYETRKLNTREHSPWEVMHALIAYGVQTEIHRGGPGGPKVNAIGWLCWDGRCAGDTLLARSRHGIEGRIGPGLQGHAGQFLGMLAQSRVKIDYAMQVGGQPFTVADLVEAEKRDCRAGTELTFKLIALSHYLDHSETWTCQDGQQWSISRLISEELRQPIRGAACGGTHRLFGLSYAYITQYNRGEPIDGEYNRAKAFIADYHRYTFGSLQNADGSFSTQWFTRPEARADLDRRLQTSGHILEWLTFSVPDEMLYSPNMVRAVDYLSGILLEHRSRQWSIGPLGHAIHALAMYNERAFPESLPSAAPSLVLDDPVTALADEVGAVPGRTSSRRRQGDLLQ